MLHEQQRGFDTIYEDFIYIKCVNPVKRRQCFYIDLSKYLPRQSVYSTLQILLIVPLFYIRLQYIKAQCVLLACQVIEQHS